MRRISLGLMAAILVFATAIKASAQTEQTRQVSGFTSLSTSGWFDIHVKIDGTESLKITADKDIINYIETTVSGGKLKIGFKDSRTQHRNVGKVDVYVTAKSLSGISNAGSGSVKVDGEMQGGTVDLHISGSGNITTGVKADRLTSHISGSGSVTISGSANDADFEVGGSGQINGKTLKTSTASVHLSGSGNAYIDADKSLSVHIAGSGSVMYTGKASVSSHVSGSGSIRKKGDE